MVELSESTRARVRVLFPGAERSSVEALLESDVADNLPLLGTAATPESLERVRFAVLKVSDGDRDRLVDAVALAQADWRDVLVAAGFANDVHAHEAWVPAPPGARGAGRR